MYDLILKGGLVVDGTRKAPYTANVCIADGKIAKITAEDAEAAEILDVTGLAVSPASSTPTPTPMISTCVVTLWRASWLRVLPLRSWATAAPV